MTNVDPFAPVGGNTQTVEGLGQTVILHTVDGSHMPMYITANGRCRGCDRPILQYPVRRDPPKRRWWWDLLPRALDNRLAARKYRDWAQSEDVEMEGFCECETPRQIPVVGPEGSCKGKTLAICGAGPSLEESRQVVDSCEHVWGCNRAANWLADEGWPITHGICIDPSDAMYSEAWSTVPDVPAFLLATSVNPRLTDHILGSLKPVVFFHSVRGGFPGELDLYQILYPECPIVGRGLNVPNRGLELAIWLGYDTVYMVGCEMSLGHGDRMYAGGEKGDVQDPDAIVESEPIEGHVYRTRPDMLMSARSLAEFKLDYPDRVELVGDRSLPAALYRMETREPGFLDRCVQYTSLYEEKRDRLDSRQDP